MFRNNVDHLQTGIFYNFPFKMAEFIKSIEDTKEYFFYENIFCKIDESIFAELYCDNNGCPNAPINVMVSALFLKEKRNWSYSEMFRLIKYDLSIRAALGIFTYYGMPFSESTIFNFQNLINAYREETGVNLFEKVFDKLTLSQVEKYKVKTNIVRTDSFMVDSNIRKYGRLQLLIEILKRLYRILSRKDKKKLLEYFSAYLESTSERYLYDLKSSDLPHELDKIASVYFFLKTNLSASYKSRKEYQNFTRIFTEHFVIEAKDIKLREQSELDSNILQSPDDEDATFRTKRKKSYRGQSGNIIETISPENELNLVLDIALVANNVDDSTILNDRLDIIKEKAEDIDEVHQDGAYGSKDNDKKMKELGITAVQTAVRGRKSDVTLDIEVEENGAYKVSCPNAQTVKAEPTSKRFKACFDKDVCKTCPFLEKCPTSELKNCRVFYFSSEDFERHKRNNNVNTIPPERRTLRANVEATVHEFTYNMRGHKLKVRGAFKAELYLFCMGIMINFGRIYRYVMK